MPGIRSQHLKCRNHCNRKHSEEVKIFTKLLEQRRPGFTLPGEEEPADAGADPLAADPLAAEEPAHDDTSRRRALDAEATRGRWLDEDIPLGATDDFANLDGQNLGDFAGEGKANNTIDLGALQSIEALNVHRRRRRGRPFEFNEEEDEKLEEGALSGLAKGIGRCLSGCRGVVTRWRCG